MLFAATYVGGVFKSSSGGGSWSGVNTGLPNYSGVKVVAIDPQTPATLYAGTSGRGVFKSVNAGGSWGADNSGLTASGVWALAIEPGRAAGREAGRLGGGGGKRRG